MYGAPEQFTQHTDLVHRKAEQIVHDIHKVLNDAPALPKHSAASYYPIDTFLQSEINTLSQLIQTIQSETDLLFMIWRGDLQATPELEALLEDIAQDRIPRVWLAQSFPSSQTLRQWTRGLPRRLQMLIDYQNEATVKVTAYELAAFSRPDCFFQILLQTFARKEFREITTLRLQTEVSVVKVEG